MTDKDILTINRRLLEPYTIPAECPYLSEDQRDLSRLDFEGRCSWMAEWLSMAQACKSTAGIWAGSKPGGMPDNRHDNPRREQVDRVTTLAERDSRGD